MTDQALEARIRGILHELTATDPGEIRLEHRLREDLGLDSVSSMELVGMLSEELDIDVEIEEAMEVADVRGVLDMARRHLAA